jgi:DNA-binding GntR family transcriptional regulator
MAKQHGAESLAAFVCDQLRNEIYGREVEPGQRLLPAELGQRFGVSLSVVREALGILAATDLVRIERNRGFHVTPLSPEALTQLTFARKLNEGAALRLSVEQGDVTWESEVLAAHHRMASQPILLPGRGRARLRNQDWAVAHVAFHHQLIAACGNDMLLGICDRLSDSAELYRAWSGAARNAAARDIAGEHRALMEAALAHKADLAVRLFEAHVDRTANMVLESSPQQPRPARTV